MCKPPSAVQLLMWGSATETCCQLLAQAVHCHTQWMASQRVLCTPGASAQHGGSSDTLIGCKKHPTSNVTLRGSHLPVCCLVPPCFQPTPHYHLNTLPPCYLTLTFTPPQDSKSAPFASHALSLPACLRVHLLSQHTQPPCVHPTARHHTH